MTDWIAQREKAAAEKVRSLLDLPMPTDRHCLGAEGEFDPWQIFPAIYGSYCASFDRCAIEVLTEIQVNYRVREDLGADMLREMLCVSDLCNYGTSPRVCFPTTYFKPLIPELIEKWRTWAALSWGEDWDKD